MIVLKVNDALMTKLGATQADFESKVAELLAAHEQLTKSMSDQSTGLAAFETRLAALEKQVAAIPPAAPGLTAETVKPIIATEASRIVAEAMGATGTSPLKPSPAAPIAPTSSELIAAGKYEEAYAASEELRAEFDSVASFKAYSEAEKAGAVRISKK